MSDAPFIPPSTVPPPPRPPRNTRPLESSPLRIVLLTEHFREKVWEKVFEQDVSTSPAVVSVSSSEFGALGGNTVASEGSVDLSLPSTPPFPASHDTFDLSAALLTTSSVEDKKQIARLRRQVRQLEVACGMLRTRNTRLFEEKLDATLDKVRMESQVSSLKYERDSAKREAKFEAEWAEKYRNQAEAARAEVHSLRMTALEASLKRVLKGTEECTTADKFMEEVSELKKQLAAATLITTDPPKQPSQEEAV